MKCDPMTFFKIAVEVAVHCAEPLRPDAMDTTPENAAEYVRDVLGTVFNGSGVEFTVRPMDYPKCCKVPVRISLHGIGECVFWYYGAAPCGEVMIDLEGALHNMVYDMICAPIEGGVSA